MSRDEASLRRGLTDDLASRIAEGRTEGFDDAEAALLCALPELHAGRTDSAVAILRDHFDAGEDRGEVGQIVHAWGLYRGIHATLAAMGAEIYDDDGIAFSERAGFGVVLTDEGRLVPREDVKLP